MPLSGLRSLRWGFVSFTGARTLISSDAFQYLRSLDNGGNQNVTLPPAVDLAFEPGTQISFEQVGTSTITLVPGAAVTINSRGALLVSNGQSAVVSIVLGPTLDTWTAFGDLV